jgi:uncharacterized protein involved in exopolysaccharide biosynthesis
MSLLDWAIVLARKKLLLVAVTAAGGAIVAAFSLLLPDIFTSTARVLPPQQHGSAGAAAAAFLAQGASLPALAFGGPSLSHAELYVGILRSRTIADALIARFDLQAGYEQTSIVATRKALAARTAIRLGKDGLIAIEVDDADPAQAAEIANAYVEELERLVQTLATTEAAQRRLFVEKQLKRTKDALVEAETALRSAQESSGVIKLDEQARALIGSIALLRSEIASKEVQLRAMGTFATAQNPEVVRLQEQIAGLRVQLTKLETGGAKDTSLLVTGPRMTGAGMDFVRRVREVKYQEALFEALVRQYELARMDEARESAEIQVVDQAVPQDRPSKPKRTLLTLLGALLALVLAVIVVLLQDSHARAVANPDLASRWTELRRQLRL